MREFVVSGSTVAIEKFLPELVGDWRSGLEGPEIASKPVKLCFC